MSLTSRTLWLFSIIAIAVLIPLELVFHGGYSCENYDLPGVSFDLTPDYG
jgi:hypothetical protein